MPCDITNNSPYDTSSIEKMAHSLYPFAQKRMGFHKPPQIKFDSDPQNAKNILGKTAQYEPGTMTIVVFVNDRHPKDILRSIAHELVHHTQNCRGEFEKGGTTELGYAQTDDHMREMEREAYEVGNMCFRDWEDGIKSQMPLHETIYKQLLKKGDSYMSTKNWKNAELNTLLMEKWGYKAKEEKKELLKEGDPWDCPKHQQRSDLTGECVDEGGSESLESIHGKPEKRSEIVEEEVDAFMNMKSDYKTGQKEIPKDALEEEEEEEFKVDSDHPQGPASRQEVLDQLDEKTLRRVIRQALQKSLQAQ